MAASSKLSERQQTILSVVAAGECTLEQGIAQHGLLGLTQSRVREMYWRLVERGLLVPVGKIFRVPPRPDGAREPYQGVVVPARTATPFRQLRQPSLSQRSPRAGALDFRTIPSRVGDALIEYTGPRSFGGFADGEE